MLSLRHLINTHSTTSTYVKLVHHCAWGNQPHYIDSTKFQVPSTVTESIYMSNVSTS